MSELARYGGVFLTFARNSLIRDMTFRTNFLIECVSTAGWTLMNVGFYLIVFSVTESLGAGTGWGRWEFFVFLATTLIVNGIVQMLFMENAQELSELIRTGNLDFVLLRPIDTQFLVSLRRFDWSSAATLGIGVVLLVVSLVQLTRERAGPPDAGPSVADGASGRGIPGREVDVERTAGPATDLPAVDTAPPEGVNPLSAGGQVRATPLRITPASIILYVFYIACGVAIMYSLMLSLAATSIWLGRNQTLYDFWFYITNFSRYPMEIYARGWGVPLLGLFTFVVPVLVVVNVPARLLAQPLDPKSWWEWPLAGFTILATAVSLLASRAIFQFALRSYRSASS